jgi:hypothetical protein
VLCGEIIDSGVVKWLVNVYMKKFLGRLTEQAFDVCLGFWFNASVVCE